MDKPGNKFKDVESYIASFPPKVQIVLKKIRSTIRKAAPKAKERISYNMPFYEYGGTGYAGRLLYFAGFKNHISLFIIPSKADTVPSALKKFHTSKATYQFPLDKPFPFDVLEKSIKELVKERDLKNKAAEKKQPAKTKSSIGKDIVQYHKGLSAADKKICNLLAEEVNTHLPKAESKVWHGHPVWFLDGNPIVGYSKQKQGMRLMFWSGADFDEDGLNVKGKKFKDASVFYNDASEINKKDLKRWLKKSEKIQWDYKNIVKRKGRLERLK